MTERNLTWVVSEMTHEMREDVERQVNKALDDPKNEDEN